LNVKDVHITVLNVLLMDVSVPLTESNNHTVSVEMDTMMLVNQNVSYVNINVPLVPTLTIVTFVLLTDLLLV
jgi:uncharacterized membrane protein